MTGSRGHTATGYLAGYVTGAVLFMVIIPFVLYLSSIYLDLSYRLITNTYIRTAIVLVLFCTGIAFMIWSLVILYKVGKGGPAVFYNVEISPRSKILTTSGPYGFTRNPMLLGTCLYYYAVSFFLNSITPLLVSIAFIVIMLVYIKFIEEQKLMKEFDGPYREYKKSTPMFFPRIIPHVDGKL